MLRYFSHASTFDTELQLPRVNRRVLHHSRTGHQQIPKSNIVRFRDFAFGVRTGMVKNTSVRARRFIADALRGFPFKGIGVSREKVRFFFFKRADLYNTSARRSAKDFFIDSF